MKQEAGIRPAQLAGQWYPAEAQQLAREVDRYIGNAQVGELDGEVVGIMAPHAGYYYSGPVAGYAFAALRGLQPDLVVIFSPMHQPYYGALMSTTHTAYTTPLGDIPVDQDAVELLGAALKEDLDIELVKIRHDPEHAIEIELPFLQRSLSTPFSILPVMVRDQSAAVAQGLAQTLGRLYQEDVHFSGRSALLVASTDLSHYYPHSRARVLDSQFLEQVASFDPLGVIRAEEQGRGFACGRGALAAVMWLAAGLGATHSKVLHYATSGDVSGEYDRVVGYAAAAFLR